MYRKAVISRGADKAAIGPWTLYALSVGICHLLGLYTRCVRSIDVIIALATLEKPRSLGVVAQRHLPDLSVQFYHVFLEPYHVTITISPCHPRGVIVVNQYRWVDVGIRTMRIKCHIVCNKRCSILSCWEERTCWRITHCHIDGVLAVLFIVECHVVVKLTVGSLNHLSCPRAVGLSIGKPPGKP